MSDLQSPRPDTPPSPPEERARKSRTMVLLSPPQALDALALSELIEEGDIELDGSPKSPQAFTALQLALNPSATVYHGYETYIEEGLICLKHKIRNIEKKKLKLEGYRLRLNNGETLNKDQLNAVEKYEEVVHNLIFARDLQKTFCDLTQDLLKAQKKAVRREQTLKASTEQRRLCIMLQVQYVLRSLQRDDVRKNFCNAREHAKFLSTQEVENLLDLASLLGCKRDERMSLEDQMEQASFVYLNLLDGKDKPVAGSTYKHFKEKLLRLLDCGFFDHLPPPQKCTSGVLDGLKPNASTPCSLPALVSLNSNEVPSRKFLNRRYSPEAVLTGNSHGEERDVTPPPNWRAEFLALKEQEPPDSWDMELCDAPRPSQTVLQKPWKGAAGFIPKTPVVIMKNPAADSKQKRQRKTKGSQESKCDAEVEVFNSPSSLAKDPTLRRQQLDNLMDQITGSFSFIQDSLLDGEASPTNGRSMRLHLSPGSSPLAQREQKKPLADELTQNQHSTPLHARVVSGDGKIPLINGNQTLDSCGLELHTEDTPNAKQDEGFTSPPLYCRESCISLPLEDKNSKQTGKLCNGEMPTPVSAQSFTTPPSRRSLTMANASPFDSMHSVFSGEPPITVSSELKSESGFSGSVCLSYSTASSLSYTTASTQTPPEFSLPQDDLQMESAYLSESDLSGTSQVYSSPGPPSALQPQSSLSQPPYYPRNTLRGTARGSRGLPHSYRSPGSSRGDYEVLRVNMRAPGGGYIGQTHRDPGSLLYNSRENGYQLNHKRTGGPAAQRNSSAGWSDSSQVSSPDRDCTYLLDSGHGDSLSISPLEVPVAGQGTHTLLPVHVYPVSQQLRVAFSAARTANFAPGTLDQPIAFDLLHSNLGDVFDASSGRFSCPAAGTYVFIFHILKLAVNVPLYINLMRNEEVMVSAYANDGAPDHETASNHAVIQLYHGDQVWLRLHRGAIYGSSWKYSTFSGFLLYQD